MAPRAMALATILLCTTLGHLLADESSRGADRLTAGSSLRGSQQLVSRNGTVALGFFSPPKGLEGIADRYLGIWFHNVSGELTVIWIANRDRPVSADAILRISNEGHLHILEADNATVIWSSNSQRRAAQAVLLDSGNLILTSSLSSVEDAMVWQSFNHPADVWVPSMKMFLGSNLTSWKSSISPASGRFVMRMLPTKEFVISWNGSLSTRYWTSGPWNGIIFSDVPEMTQNYLYTFSFNSSGPYFTWEEKQGISNRFSYFRLEENGAIRVHTWDQASAQWYNIWTVPNAICTVDHLCGSNSVCSNDATPACQCPVGFTPASEPDWKNEDWSRGCVLLDLNHHGDSCGGSSFTRLDHTSYGSPAASTYSGKSWEWCRSKCLENCSCAAFSSDADHDDGSCFLYQSPLVNGRTSGGIAGTVFLRSTSSTSGAARNRSSIRVILLAVGAAVAALAFLAAAGIFITRRRRNRRRALAPRSSSAYFLGLLTAFSYKELQAATDNFSHLLGSGGFGEVFRGVLQQPGGGGDKPPPEIIAVKRLVGLHRDDKQFRAEVSTIGTIQHINLVRLLGFCAEGSVHRLLVYEFLDNGSLDRHLFDHNTAASKLLNWSLRFSIALGTAKGIAYLHEECRDCIIHCDIKPENILVDAEFNPKVADFGLAKLLGREFSRVITSMRGTRGYLAPEWLSNMPITAKADVYSYGMTLLEMISGRRNIDPREIDSQRLFFPYWAAKQMKLGNLAELPDKRLNGDVDQEELQRAVKTAIWCVQDDEMNRPSMKSVVQMLEGTVHVAEPPMPESFKILVASEDQDE